MELEFFLGKRKKGTIAGWGWATYVTIKIELDAYTILSCSKFAIILHNFIVEDK